MHRDTPGTGQSLVIVATVMLIAAGGAITAVADSRPEAFLGQGGSGGLALPDSPVIRNVGYTARMLPIRHDAADVPHGQRRYGGSVLPAVDPSSRAAAGADPIGPSARTPAPIHALPSQPFSPSLQT